MIARALVLIALLVGAQCTSTGLVGRVLLTELRARTNDVIDDGLELLA